MNGYREKEGETEAAKGGGFLGLVLKAWEARTGLREGGCSSVFEKGNRGRREDR